MKKLRWLLFIPFGVIEAGLLLTCLISVAAMDLFQGFGSLLYKIAQRFPSLEWYRGKL